MKAIQIQNNSGIIFLTYSESGKHWDLFHSDQSAIDEATAQAKEMGWTYNQKEKNIITNYLAENHWMFGYSETMDINDPFAYVRSLTNAKQKHFMHEQNLPYLVGRKIKWYAPIYKGNLGYYGYGEDGGTCIIKAIDLKARKPIVETEIIEGADISYGFHDNATQSMIAYSDSDRIISFEICE
jgi:hypothetical protein